jgi:CRISPR-associated protein Csm5
MRYKILIQTLTPLHIGTGAELLKDFDFVARGSTTYVLNQDAIYMHEFDSRGGEARLSVPAGHLQPASTFTPESPFVRYILSGSTMVERIREQIKTVQDECYLPGSSLKGALRTAILVYQVATSEILPDIESLMDDPREAAKPWEKNAFGANPNLDLMRCVQVSDSRALFLDPSPLQLCPAHVYTSGEPGSPVVVEAIRPGQTLETEINIDELTLQYADELMWNNKTHWIVSLPGILQTFSRRRIEAELQVAEAKRFNESADFLRNLLEQAIRLEGSRSVLIQLGWGTGWGGMTVGPWLDWDSQNDIRERYKLGKPPTASKEWEPNLNSAFPDSRRLSDSGSLPGLPLGWVKLTLEPASPPTALWEQLQQVARDAFTPLPEIQLKLRKTASESLIPEQAAEPALLSPLIESFSSIPEDGNRFDGKVYFCDGDRLYIEIPGLNPDSQAVAVIAPASQWLLKNYEDGSTLRCTVIRTAKDPSQANMWLVYCFSENDLLK